MCKSVENVHKCNIPQNHKLMVKLANKLEVPIGDIISALTSKENSKFDYAGIRKKVTKNVEPYTIEDLQVLTRIYKDSMFKQDKDFFYFVRRRMCDLQDLNEEQEDPIIVAERNKKLNDYYSTGIRPEVTRKDAVSWLNRQKMLIVDGLREAIDKITKQEQIGLLPFDQGALIAVTRNAIEKAQGKPYAYHGEYLEIVYVPLEKLELIKAKADAGGGCITLEEKEIIFAILGQTFTYGINEKACKELGISDN